MIDPPDFSESYQGIREEIIELLDAARSTSARSVNAVMTATYWEIGQRIIQLSSVARNAQVTERH